MTHQKEKLYIFHKMSFAGKVEQHDLIQHIQPAYDKLLDYSYDITKAKTIMVDFITKYCKTMTHPQPMHGIDNYSISIYGKDGLVIKPKVKKYGIRYMFCVKTGKVYVSEHKGTEFKCPDAAKIPFDLLVMMVQDPRSDSHIKCTLLSPKI